MPRGACERDQPAAVRNTGSQLIRKYSSSADRPYTSHKRNVRSRYGARSSASNVPPLRAGAAWGSAGDSRKPTAAPTNASSGNAAPTRNRPRQPAAAMTSGAVSPARTAPRDTHTPIKVMRVARRARGTYSAVSAEALL